MGEFILEFILEIVGGILELLLDGVFDCVMARKGPMPLRIFLAAVLIVLPGGIVVALSVLAFQNKSLILALVALGVSALFLGVAIHKIKKYKRKRY